MTDQHAPQLYDDYISKLFSAEDEALRLAREDAVRAGLPPINVSASEGKLLQTLAFMIGARRILEVGTLGGYSAIWLSRALPADGKMITLEISPLHARVAQQNIERAGLSNRVDVRVGPASETLSQMAAANEPEFDLAFIDADKDGYVGYLQQVEPMVRKGGLILADNTLPREVLQANADAGAKRYNSAVAVYPGLTSIIIPCLRGHEIDGLLVSVKGSLAHHS